MEQKNKNMATTSAATTVFALVSDPVQAQEAIFVLRDMGFRYDAVSLLSPNNAAGRDNVRTQNPTNAFGVLGGIGGFLVGIRTLVIPGVGPFIVAGPIIAALSGIANGATVGGVAGGLLGMGVSNYKAKTYDSRVNAGKTLIAMHCIDTKQAAHVEDILTKAEATDISTAIVLAKTKPKKNQKDERRQPAYA